MKTPCNYLNEKGQDIVEYAIMLAFCAVLVTGLRSDAFNDTLRAVFDRGIYDDVSTTINAGTYAQAGKLWSQSSRRTLNKIQYSYGRYYLGEDIVSNDKRLAADKEALTNIANFFLGMSVATAKEKVFVNESGLNDNHFTKGTDVLIANFLDDVYGVEDTYDPNTQQYEVTTRTTLEKGVRKNLDSREVFYWMQGNYGFSDPNDPNSFSRDNYAANNDFNQDDSKFYYSDKRFFFSNQMIDPDGTPTGGTVKRNIRINMKSSDGVTIDTITVRAQRNGMDIPELKITLHI